MQKITLKNKTILVTGSAGFIGSSLVNKLLCTQLPNVLPDGYDFEAHKELVPMRPGDVPVTYADTSVLERNFGFKPNTPFRDGLCRFAEWYKVFYIVERVEK